MWSRCGLMMCFKPWGGNFCLGSFPTQIFKKLKLCVPLLEWLWSAVDQQEMRGCTDFCLFGSFTVSTQRRMTAKWVRSKQALRLLSHHGISLPIMLKERSIILRAHYASRFPSVSSLHMSFQVGAVWNSETLFLSLIPFFWETIIYSHAVCKSVGHSLFFNQLAVT